MLERMTNKLNTLFRFDHSERSIFYELLQSQLQSGVVPKKVFTSLEVDLQVSPEIVRVARACRQAIDEGRLSMEGLKDCNLFPFDEAYLLIEAERKDVLVDVLSKLCEQQERGYGFFQAVILPNLYYMALASLLFFFILKTRDIVDGFTGIMNVSNSAMYELSVQANAMVVPGILIFVLVGLFIWFCSCHLFHPFRRFVPYFAVDMQLQYGVKFCLLSQSFYGIGASHGDILDVAQKIFVGSGFMRNGMARLQVLYKSQGEDYSQALGETIILPSIARIMQGMTLNENRSNYALAHGTANKLQLTLLKRRHGRAKTVLQILLLSGIAYMLITLLTGIYSFYDLPR